MTVDDVADDVFTFSEILRAEESGDLGRLNEISLQRAWLYFQETKARGFVIVTAYRQSQTSEQNEKAYQQLATAIRASGLSFAKMRGAWLKRQEPEPGDEHGPEKRAVLAFEPYCFVPGATLQQAKDWAKAYGQDAVIYHGEDAAEKTLRVTRVGTSWVCDTFDPDKIAQACSEARGHPFALEWARQGGWGEALIIDYVKNTK